MGLWMGKIYMHMTRLTLILPSDIWFLDSNVPSEEKNILLDATINVGHNGQTSNLSSHEI